MRDTLQSLIKIVIPAKAGMQSFCNRACGSSLMLTVLAGALHVSEATAGHASGQITAIRSRASDGLVWINISGPRYEKPTCATFDYMMIKDENSETGKKQFSMLLQAHATGKSVIIHGTGDCSRWGDGESINIVEIRQ